MDSEQQQCCMACIEVDVATCNLRMARVSSAMIAAAKFRERGLVASPWPVAGGYRNAILTSPFQSSHDTLISGVILATSPFADEQL